MNRKMYFLFVVVLLAVIFTGCGSRDISLHQSADAVDKIELLYSPFHEYEVLYTLTDEEISGCMEKVSQLVLQKHTSPQDVGGSLILRITYSDGSVESLGSWSVSYESGGKLEHDGWYYVSQDDLYDLFSQYLEPSQLADLSV